MLYELMLLFEHPFNFLPSASFLILLCCCCKILDNNKKKCCIYGFNKEKEDGNLHFREFNENQFFKDFESCKAVVSNGGFTLISESIYLKKPIFCIPVKKQPEQTVNAMYIEKLGYGEFHESLTKENFEMFLDELEVYRKSLSSFKHNGNQKILDALDKAIEKYSKEYSASTYRIVNLIESRENAK